MFILIAECLRNARDMFSFVLRVKSLKSHRDFRGSEYIWWLTAEQLVSCQTSKLYI